jgi:hypothetical protein
MGGGAAVKVPGMEIAGSLGFSFGVDATDDAWPQPPQNFALSGT